MIRLQDNVHAMHNCSLTMLDPAVILRADAAAVLVGAKPEVRGAVAVAGTFAGRAKFAQPALINGTAGAVWAPGGQPRVAFSFTLARGKIVAIDLLADPAQLSKIDLSALNV